MRLLVLAWALCSACARTEVVVTIVSKELSTPADFDRLSIDVINPALDPNGTQPLYAPPPLTVCAPGQASGCYALPLTVTLYPGGNRPDEKVRVAVQALHGGDPVPAIAQAAVFTFTKGASEHLQFDLYRNCLKVDCAQFDQACGAMGTCLNIAPRPANAPADAGSSNAGMVTLLSANPGEVSPTMTASFDVLAPANVKAGDLLVMAASISENLTDPAPASPGWALETNVFGLTRVAIFTRVVGPSEPSSYTFTSPMLPGSFSCRYYLLQLRGARALDGIHALSESPPFYAPTVTTTQPGDLLLTFANHGGVFGSCTPSAGATLVGGDFDWTIWMSSAGAPGPTGDRPFACVSPNNPMGQLVAATYAVAPE